VVLNACYSEEQATAIAREDDVPVLLVRSGIAADTPLVPGVSGAKDNRAGTDRAEHASDPAMKYYLYISQTKIDMLFTQLPASARTGRPTLDFSVVDKVAIVCRRYRRRRWPGRRQSPKTFHVRSATRPRVRGPSGPNRELRG